ncbi:hypothetical protein FKP32DRAFT_1599115 [Trametes sanguinea]|nr:hypothetical protein FKP32DRAFT_1599115 [Trametes sanguinea]
MVSADNLNFDCLELIFAYLAVNDLVSVSLVSRSFLAAAIPRLYRTLTFGLNQAKRYPHITSPFAVVLNHPNLASHVRHIEIRAIPTIKLAPQPQFLSDCARTISICQNLGAFTCTLDVMPAFLPSLREVAGLQQIRFVGTLTTKQSELLLQISSLREITIDNSTWNVVDILPKWARVLQSTLSSLTLYNMQHLSTDILDTVLPSLPRLTRLHVVACSKVDQAAILKLISHTPNLESLAFTTYDTSRPLPVQIAPLPRLRHLALDTQTAPTPAASAPAFWTTMIDLTRTWSCPLKSLTLRLSDKVELGDAFVRNVVDSHHATLVHLALLNCKVTRENVKRICRKCTELERVALSIPDKDSMSFAEALAFANRIHTVTDVADVHSSHAPHAPLSRIDVRTIMTYQPSIERIVADGRIWTAIRRPGQLSDDFELALEKKKASPPSHWFMPPASIF